MSSYEFRPPFFCTRTGCGAPVLLYLHSQPTRESSFLASPKVTTLCSAKRTVCCYWWHFSCLGTGPSNKQTEPEYSFAVPRWSFQIQISLTHCSKCLYLIFVWALDEWWEEAWHSTSFKNDLSFPCSCGFREISSQEGILTGEVNLYKWY